ncbi:MAG: pyroglutamyl-peptidase I [Pseudomonadota bacterium]
MPTLLISGFEPFAGKTFNTSQHVAEALDGQHLTRDVEIRSVVLPVVRGEAITQLLAACTAHNPDTVIMLGEVDNRTSITPERVALNMEDFRIPDNHGNQPRDTPIHDHGPAAYFATIPVTAMVEAIVDCGLPAEVSNSAGTFVCNHLFYGLMRHIHQDNDRLRAGFIHLPAILPDETPADMELSLSGCVDGIRAAATAVYRHGSCR